MRIFSPSVLFFIAISFYLAGVFMMPKSNIDSLKQNGTIKQEQTIYYDNNGEEHESESLMTIKNLGPILTYKDIYFATIPFLVISLVLARIIFQSEDELRFGIYTNCIIGFLLLWITTAASIIPTILYWSGIVVASFIPFNRKKLKEQSDEK